MDYDVFNGDADGLCALLQLRLAEPRSARLITGVKRDIQLLKRVQAGTGDRVTVLDVSMAKNHDALVQLLTSGAEVLYIDHHQVGEIPGNPNLEAIIDTDADVCTSLLVDQRLGGRYREWAVTAAFGDNLRSSALRAAESLNLSTADLAILEQLGICLNYNGYGSSLDELLMMPEILFQELLPFESPFAFIEKNQKIYDVLLNGYLGDMDHASHVKPIAESETNAVYMLPDTPWARRVSGVLANTLANASPDRAHAIVTKNAEGDLTVSVRAPLTNKTGADELCQSFPTGGGRKAAAGINHLPESQMDEFIRRFAAQYASA